MKSNLKAYRVGERNQNTQGCWMEIIEDYGWCNCIVRFDDGFTKKVRYDKFKNGEVTNPYYRSIYGIGYNGIGKYSRRGTPSIYRKWFGMFDRCYSEKLRDSLPTYNDCTVDERWHCLQDFGIWYEENWKSWMDSKWDLDKDILFKGNKIYSPDTCCLVPKEINICFTKRQNHRGDYPIGVTLDKRDGKLMAKIHNIDNSTTSKRCDTELEAFLLYKHSKECDIKRKANKWKDKLEPKVYDALMNWSVDIKD